MTFRINHLENWCNEIAAAVAPHGIAVDRCRHPSVGDAVYWLFKDGRQIATVACRNNGDGTWDATLMKDGVPYAQRPKFADYNGALSWVIAELIKARLERV